jgi:choice-of-anchor C domain-containing protein
MHRIAATIALFAFAHLVWGAPFQNGSFEFGSPIASPGSCFVTLPNGSTNITGWTVIQGNIDWVGPACGAQTQTDGLADLDLVGDQGVGGVLQTFDTVPGSVYQVTFDLNGNYGGPPVIKPLNVTVLDGDGTCGDVCFFFPLFTNDYTLDTTGENTGNAATYWATKTFTFVAASTSATISFVSDTTQQGGVVAGAIIDNVRITTPSGVSPPSISKSFGAANIPQNGSTSLSFTVTNPSIFTILTGIGFTDTLPAGLVVSTPNGLSGTCGGGTISATAGSGVVSLTGATLEMTFGLTCTFSVNVTGTTLGPKTNTVTVTSTNGGTGNTATASLTVITPGGTAPPTIAKSFGAATMAINESTALSFIVNNTNTTTALTGIGFTDALPGGLVIASPGLSGSCGGGTLAAPVGSGTVSLTGATLAGGASCAFSVSVTATSAGTKNNTTGPVTSNEGGTGGTASASIRVSSPPQPPPCVPPTITSGPFPSAIAGVPYAFTVTASGDAPVTIAVTGLPAGLAFNPATGGVSGVPTVGGTVTVVVTASNRCPTSAVQTQMLTVAKAPATITLSASPNPAYFGQAVTVVACVTAAPLPAQAACVVAAAPLPVQGTVLLCAREVAAFCPPPFDTVPPGTPASLIRTPLSAPLDATGQAIFVLSGLKIDSYVLKATYSGDAAHLEASATPIDEFVIKGILLPAPKVALAAPLRASSGASLSIGVKVTPTSDSPAPTGTVRLFAGGDVVGTATLDANATAQFNIVAATTGTLALRADYSGDALYPAAASPESLITTLASATADIPAVGPVGLALLALALAVLGVRPLRRRGRRS